jgi:hypothetical protein
MILFAYISDNIERIKKDVRLGIIPLSILIQWEAYARFDYYIKAGNSKTMAVFYVSEDYRKSEREVYRIIKKMQSDEGANNKL